MEENKSSKMGTMPIGKLLASMSIPAIFSMLVQSLYNVVDSIFVAQIGESALTAVSIAFPMQTLLLAFSLGVGIGTNSLIARKLGEKKKESANKAANHGIILAIINSVIFMLIGIFVSKAFVGMFTTDANILSMGSDYLIIVMGCSFGMFIEITCSRILQATGNMMVPMVSQLLGAVTNIVLDPIMIFGYFGCPAMGVKGAAIATVIGQIVAMLFVVYVLIKKDHEVDVSLRKFKFEAKTTIAIYKVGLPSIVMNAVGALTTTLMNAILITFSTTAVAVLGIYFKLQSFVFMPIFGLTQGAMPIFGYNFGANNKKRFLHTFKLILITSVSIMIMGMLIFWIVPSQLLLLFNGTDQLVEMGISALHILSLCFIPAAISICMSTIYQSMGQGVQSLFMSLLRQIIILLPLAFILGNVFGLNSIWYCYFISELISALVFIPLCIKKVKKEFKKKELQVSGNI